MCSSIYLSVCLPIDRPFSSCEPKPAVYRAVSNSQASLSIHLSIHLFIQSEVLLSSSWQCRSSLDDRLDRVGWYIEGCCCSCEQQAVTRVVRKALDVVEAVWTNNCALGLGIVVVCYLCHTSITITITSTTTTSTTISNATHAITPQPQSLPLVLPLQHQQLHGWQRKHAPLLCFHSLRDANKA